MTFSFFVNGLPLSVIEFDIHIKFKIDLNEYFDEWKVERPTELAFLRRNIVLIFKLNQLETSNISKSMRRKEVITSYFFFSCMAACIDTQHRENEKRKKLFKFVFLKENLYAHCILQ